MVWGCASQLTTLDKLVGAFRYHEHLQSCSGPSFEGLEILEPHPSKTIKGPMKGSTFGSHHATKLRIPVKQLEHRFAKPLGVVPAAFMS